MTDHNKWTQLRMCVQPWNNTQLCVKQYLLQFQWHVCGKVMTAFFWVTLLLYDAFCYVSCHISSMIITIKSGLNLRLYSPRTSCGRERPLLLIDRTAKQLCFRLQAIFFAAVVLLPERQCWGVIRSITLVQPEHRQKESYSCQNQLCLFLNSKWYQAITLN